MALSGDFIRFYILWGIEFVHSMGVDNKYRELPSMYKFWPNLVSFFLFVNLFIFVPLPPPHSSFSIYFLDWHFRQATTISVVSIIKYVINLSFQSELYMTNLERTDCFSYIQYFRIIFILSVSSCAKSLMHVYYFFCQTSLACLHFFLVCLCVLSIYLIINWKEHDKKHVIGCQFLKVLKFSILF